MTPVLTLPILDKINETVTVGASGSSLLATQAAVRLLAWGINTGLGTDEIAEIRRSAGRDCAVRERTEKSFSKAGQLKIPSRIQYVTKTHT